MVKDHSDIEKGNPLPPHRLLFPINSKGYFICTIPTDRIAHTTVFVTPVVWSHHSQVKKNKHRATDEANDKIIMSNNLL